MIVHSKFFHVTIMVNCVTDAQTRIRSGDSQTTHKMVGGVTLVGGNGSELTRLPGGAELNILPANGILYIEYYQSYTFVYGSKMHYELRSGRIRCDSVVNWC